MQFSRLKELVRRLGGVLVLDGEKPEFVILSYSQYEKVEAGKEIPFSASFNRHNGLAETKDIASSIADVANMEVGDEEDQKAVDKLNQEILVLKEEIRQKEEAELQSDEPFGVESRDEALVEPVINEQSA